MYQRKGQAGSISLNPNVHTCMHARTCMQRDTDEIDKEAGQKGPRLLAKWINGIIVESLQGSPRWGNVTIVPTFETSSEGQTERSWHAIYSPYKRLLIIGSHHHQVFQYQVTITISNDKWKTSVTWFKSRKACAWKGGLAQETKEQVGHQYAPLQETSNNRKI